MRSGVPGIIKPSVEDPWVGVCQQHKLRWKLFDQTQVHDKTNAVKIYASLLKNVFESCRHITFVYLTVSMFIHITSTSLSCGLTSELNGLSDWWANVIRYQTWCLHLLKSSSGHAKVENVFTAFNNSVHDVHSQNTKYFQLCFLLRLIFKHYIKSFVPSKHFPHFVV